MIPVLFYDPPIDRNSLIVRDYNIYPPFLTIHLDIKSIVYRNIQSSYKWRIKLFWYFITLFCYKYCHLSSYCIILQYQHKSIHLVIIPHTVISQTGIVWGEGSGIAQLKFYKKIKLNLLSTPRGVRLAMPIYCWRKVDLKNCIKA
jgi:hypothetical protein